MRALSLPCFRVPRALFTRTCATPTSGVIKVGFFFKFCLLAIIAGSAFVVAALMSCVRSPRPLRLWLVSSAFIGTLCRGTLWRYCNLPPQIPDPLAFCIYHARVFFVDVWDSNGLELSSERVRQVQREISYVSRTLRSPICACVFALGTNRETCTCKKEIRCYGGEIRKMICGGVTS